MQDYYFKALSTAITSKYAFTGKIRDVMSKVISKLKSRLTFHSKMKYSHSSLKERMCPLQGYSASQEIFFQINSQVLLQTSFYFLIGSAYFFAG